MTSIVIVAITAFICGIAVGATVATPRPTPIAPGVDAITRVDIDDPSKGCVLILEGTRQVRTRNDCMLIARAIFQQMQVEP